MPTLREWLRRLWGTLRPHARDREMEEELKLHLDLAGRPCSAAAPRPARPNEPPGLRLAAWRR